MFTTKVDGNFPLTIWQSKGVDQVEVESNLVKQSLLDLIAAKVYWKEEWKDAVRNLAENALVSRSSNSTSNRTLWFRGISEIYATISPFIGLTWYWTTKSSDGTVRTILVNGAEFFEKDFRADFKCSAIPYNLWLSVLKAISQGLSVLGGPEQLMPVNEPGLIYIPSQHYNVDYTDGLWLITIPDNANKGITSRPQFIADQWIAVNQDYLWRWTGDIAWQKVLPKLGSAINKAQMTKFTYLFFRHDRRKRDMAVNWMWELFRDCGSLVANEFLSKKQISISRDPQSQVLERSYLFRRVYYPVVTETLILSDHFEADEFDIFIKWIDYLKWENVKLMNLFGQSSSNVHPQSSWPGVSAFPGIDDDFSDPNNLRGRLADSSILRAMQNFGNLIQRVQAELLMCYTSLTVDNSNNNNVNNSNSNSKSSDYESATAKIPSAVTVIITDYLPFPQPPVPGPTPEYVPYGPIVDDVD